MQLTVITWDDRVVNVEVDQDESVENVKAILEAETSLPSGQQLIMFNNRALGNQETLRQCGVNAGDVCMLVPAQSQAGGQAGGPRSGGGGGGGRAAPPSNNPALAMNADGTAVAPAALIQVLKNDARQMAALEASNPRLASIVRNEDVAALQEALADAHKARLEHDAVLQREQELLMADPFDPDAQRKIEDIINQRNIEENLAQAMEHTPEVFGQVSMLYVDMEINGVPVKTFVDSGAQVTIVTQEFAERCYLTRLIDKRFAGMAFGVGSSRIIGRIHQAPLKVGGHFITSSITVLEQKDGPQFIFGLDMLRRHQCCIDLGANVLRFGSCGAELPFLPEHEIPKDFNRHMAENVSEQDAAKSMASAKRDGAAAAAGPSGGAGTSAAAPPPPLPAVTAPAARQAPAPAAPAAAAAAAGGGGNAEVEAKLEKLVALGFTRDQALAALRSAGGNEEAAAAMLFGDMTF